MESTKYILSIPDEIQLKTNVGKYRKEDKFRYSLLCLAIDRDGQIRTLIESRFYHTQSRSYNCTWLHFDKFYTSGGSFAGGYGVHLDSVALESSLTSCGVNVDGLQGRGDNAMEAALVELAEKINSKFNLGYANFTIIKAHG